MKAWCKAVGMLLAVLMAFGSFAAVPAGAAAQESEIQYIFREWDAEHHVIVNHNEACSDYTELAEVEGNRLSPGCYVVSENTTMPERLFIETGVVHLIICDDTTLTLGMGIEVAPKASLSIYTQAYNSGKIYANINRNELPGEYTDVAIIGGGIGDPDTGDITIHGGILDLNSSGWTGGSVIGGAKGGSANIISIYGGTIDLHQTGNAALLGGGNGACGSLYQGEGIRIYGGILNAEGLQGSICTGIGSGSYCDGSGGSIAIYGGTIAAVGTGGAAGIGGGSGTTNPPIDIYGGSVTAKAGGAKVTGAGIGTGCKANQTQPIGIYGGTVIASSHSGAGIGAGCGANAKEIEISDADVVSTVSAGGAGIGGGKRYEGKGGDGGNITIHSHANVVATSLSYGTAQDYVNRLDECIANSKIKLDDSAYGAGAAALISFLIEWFQSDLSGAGIGGGYEGSAGTISISDSTVTAESGSYAAAIGTGDEATSGCTINITDNAEVTATAGTDAAAIGSGNEIDGTCPINISGSTVTAHGGAYGAGIGGGDAVGGGNISITNSTVKAYGGTDAAGIGGGEGGDGGTINIIDSDVYSQGDDCGAGIGNGEDGCNTEIQINGNSTVEAIGGGKNAAAIGHAANGILYGYHVSCDFDSSLLVKAGSDKQSTNVYAADNRYNAVWNNPYAKLYVCEHAQSQWRCENAGYHVRYCDTCKYRFGSDYRAHEWDSDNICTVCGASAESATLKMIEKNNTGEVVTEKSIPLYMKTTLPECTNVPAGYEFAYWVLDVRYYSVPGAEVEYVGDHWLTAVYMPVVEANFVDAEGVERTVKARKITADFVHNLHDEMLLTGDEYYYIDEDISVNGTFYIHGTPHLIIADGKTLSFNDFSCDAFETHPDYPRSTLKIYGQRNQSGTIDCNEEYAHFCDIEQHGAILNMPYVREHTNTLSVLRGNYSADFLLQVQNGVRVTGGNVEIKEIQTCPEVLLGWRGLSDSIKIGSIRYVESVKVADNQALTDGTNIYKGTLSAEQISAIQGKVLTPYLEHDYAAPEWIWADEYRNATAVFRCKDCEDVQTRGARVSFEDEGNTRTSHAECTFNGKKYEATHSGKILWDITLAQSEGGTLRVESRQQKAGREVLVEVTADQGYALETLTVEDSAGNPIELKDNCFIMPESDVTVSASYRAVPLNITVGGVRISRSNCADILGNGTASYDFETNTLTLNNASLETVTYSQGLECAIRINQAAQTPLTIHLEGANKIVNEHTDSETTQEYGLLAFDNGAGYRFTGSGSLDISMSAQNENISYCGIETRKTTDISGANISINLPGTAKAIGYNMVYSNRLTLKDNARLHIEAGENAQSFAMANNRDFENLAVEQGSSLEATCGNAVFNSQNRITQQTQALGVGVKAKNNLYAMQLWNGTTELSSYKAVKIPFSESEQEQNAANLTLGSDITSHYYIDYSAYEGAAEIVYSYNTVNEKEQYAPQTQHIDLSDIPAAVYDAASGRVKLTVSQAPAQIAEATHIEILDGAGNVLEALDYSAKSYCDKVTAMEDKLLGTFAGSEEKAAQLKTLAHSLVAYAEAAQGVFSNYETVKVSCESEEVKAQIAAATATPHHSADNSGMIKFSSLSFVCTKDARLRLYLNTAGATDTPAAPEASRGKAALKYITKGGAKQYFVELDSIDAADFGKQITVSYGGSVITCSVLDYCGIVLGDGSSVSAALKQLAKSLIVYNANAIAYFE